MVSIRQIANCIGILGDFSIVRGFYGYAFSGHTGSLSLLTQVRLLQGKHIHLNLIRVGIESFTNADEQEIDGAVEFTRNTYATVNLGVGRVERFFITTADANGRDNINNDPEAVALTDEWTVPNSAFDVFFVLTYSGSTIGLSAVDGPCDKDAKGMDGSVVAIEGSPNTTGLALAHEVGHYLGLPHVDLPGTADDPITGQNLMFPSVPNGGNLTASQGSTMRSHCFVKSGC